MMFRAARRRRLVVVSFLAALLPSSAWATWSVVGVDRATREVGIAGASCVSGVEGIAGVLPNRGAVAAQARFNQPGIDRALELMGQDKTPQEIIRAVTDPAFAPNYDVLQFGVVTLDGTPAGYTGVNATMWAGDVQGAHASVQGNILVGEAVVTAGLAAFEADGPRCPTTLADRLMAGLEGGNARGGDRRCSGTPSETALSAFLIVAGPTDTTRNSLEIVISGPVRDANPVEQLRRRYDEWRLSHPPDAERCADGGQRDAALDGTAGAAGAPGLDGAAGAGVTTSTGGAPSDAGVRSTAAPEPGGCGCRLPRANGERGPWVGLVWAAGVALRSAARRRSVTGSRG
jgi:uncharacterized Ntn-hydrolase superfamily protein